jgi:hypothetical protein
VPLAGDLRTWRETSGLPPDDAPVIPNGLGEDVGVDQRVDGRRGEQVRAGGHTGVRR